MMMIVKTVTHKKANVAMLFIEVTGGQLETGPS